MTTARYISEKALKFSQKSLSVSIPHVVTISPQKGWIFTTNNPMSASSILSPMTAKAVGQLLKLPARSKKYLPQTEPSLWQAVTKYDYRTSLICAWADLLICKFWFFSFFSVVILFSYDILEVLLYGGALSLFFSSGSFDNRYISANVPKTDQVKNIFALILGEMYPVRLCLHILPDASLHISAGSWSGHRHMFGCVRLFECDRAGWISQHKSCGPGGSLIF